MELEHRLRRFNIKYKSNVELKINLYVDDNLSSVAKTITIPANTKIEMHSFRCPLKYKALMVELESAHQIAADVEIYRMEILIDD